ncbi:transferase [Streptosporangium nondiastaticum]|uniref:Transferase n=1 Tax=Streptosporangium nondiastaticum TaxID=35764 RepID=A0A9X7JIQ4_9ACTN|nr:transferase [Streptosporangium nondiastaticum]
MRVGLLTEGGYPYASGEGGQWCDQLVRGLPGHDFEICALSRRARQDAGGWCDLPEHVRRVRTSPLWGDPAGAVGRAHRAYGRRERRRFGAYFAGLAEALTATVEPGPEDRKTQAYRFADALNGLADLARDAGGLGSALRSEQALRILEAACRAPGSHPAAYGIRVADLLAVTALLERALRPLSLDWYGTGADRGLAGVDLCHATSAGPAALPGLLAKRFFGTPFLVTEYEVRLRAYYLNSAASAAGLSLPVRTLLSAFHRQLTAEIYARADIITPGDAQVRRWQERCGADPDRLRTVHPGLDPGPYEAVGERSESGEGTDDGLTVLWAGGKAEPFLWETLAALRQAEPEVRMRIVGEPLPGVQPVGVSYDPAATPSTYGLGSVVVLAGGAETFPRPLVEAMLCGRATVSPDSAAVREVIGGTGLVVPPRDAAALAAACLELLHDAGRRARLGAAARARALELFTTERHVTDFHGIYLELISRAPAGRDAAAPDPAVPFSRAAGSRAPIDLTPRQSSPTWAGRP